MIIGKMTEPVICLSGDLFVNGRARYIHALPGLLQGIMAASPFWVGYQYLVSSMPTCSGQQALQHQDGCLVGDWLAALADTAQNPQVDLERH